MRLYIESTIPSYVAARPARDLLQAVRQQLTRDWWDLVRGRHELFWSQLVLDEITAGEPEMAACRLALIGGIPPLESTSDAEVFAKRLPSSGLLAATAQDDAIHIALAVSIRWIFF